MLKSLKVGGNILVGTPNQAHIFNRIKLLMGKNVWEDFEYCGINFIQSFHSGSAKIFSYNQFHFVNYNHLSLKNFT